MHGMFILCCCSCFCCSVYFVVFGFLFLCVVLCLLVRSMRARVRVCASLCVRVSFRCVFVQRVLVYWCSVVVVFAIDAVCLCEGCLLCVR